MNLRVNRLLSKLGWTLGTCGLLWIAGIGSAYAQPVVPELDSGSTATGIALAFGAALLLAELYRRRG
jgi:hypothetical protein